MGFCLQHSHEDDGVYELGKESVSGLLRIECVDGLDWHVEPRLR